MLQIITSDGLDGLDLPDRHCFDGDKEWVHSDEEPSTSISVPPKALFTAGIRPGDAKVPDTSNSSMRPLTNKSISFAPDGQEGEEPQPMDEDLQQVPSGSHGASHGTGAVPKKTYTPFEKLKSKAVGAADSVKQRFKIGLPTRQKLSKEESAKLRRRPRKKGALEQEQEVPEDTEVREEEGEMEVVEQSEPQPAADTAEMETDVQEEESKNEDLASEKAEKEEALRKEKEAKEEALRKEKEAKEEALRKEKEAKEEEKLRKQKEQEELKRQKAEEKQQAKEEAQRKKAEEKLAKQKAAEEAKKAAEEAKKAKLEEQLAKAKEAQEIKRQKEEEELKKIREQEALAKELQEKKRLEDEQKRLREEEEAKQKAKEAEERKQEEAQRKLIEQEAAAAAAALAPVELQTTIPETDAATVAVEQTESSAAPVQGDVEMEEETAPEPEPTTSTPTGTGKRKVKKMTFPQMPHLPKMPDLPTLPHIDLDFRKKIIKRSKTPPARPKPPKSKATPALETENQLAAQYENEILARNAAMEEEEEEAQKAPQTVVEPQTQIFVTQPSSDQQLEESETHVEWEPNSPQGVDAEEPSTSKKPVQAKERLDKFGKSLKGFGSKSKEVASQKSKAMGQKMKVIGKDLQKFGVKVNEKYQSTIEEIKAKQEAAKARSKQKALEAEDAEEQMEYEGEYPESSTEPRRTFRFRRRDESQEESEEADSNKPQAYYENSEDLRRSNEEEGAQDDSKVTRSQLLGRAERDWESPLDLAQSRDVSEEPFSGNASSRDSPPGSSMASSTFAHVRKQGVLEEIDSDEFFLREKGISEGEDEEEINRFLVEELRNAFRPQANNALAGFDMPESPDRPEKSPRKPPRKDKEEKAQSYQTFPPERPRRKAPGYVSAYMNQEQAELEQDQESQVEERGSPQDDLREYDEDDGMRDLKEDVELLNQDREERKLGDNEGYEDDGRYEPVNEEPIKPVRTKKAPRQPATPVYYNTVEGNEWMRDLEDQVESHEEASPRPPQRERRKSSRSNQFSELSETPQVEDIGTQGGSQQLTGAESDARFTTSEADPDDGFEYVDEAGYAVVHKDRDVPRTIPRRKKKSGSKGSLKRRSPEEPKSEEAAGSEPMFFSLPRQAPKTFHVTPPSRPQRNYSTLRPRRPPRSKSSPRPDRRKGPDGDSSSPKPSTAIGIMQGRPLPPPPRPERSPIPLNDLDMSTVERSVGARHYANFADGRGEVVEEVLTATNIPLLGRRTETTDDDITIGIQTDPLLQEEPSIEAVTRSYATDSSRVQRQR